MDIRIFIFSVILCLCGNVRIRAQDMAECEPYEKKNSPSVLQLLLTPKPVKVPRDETRFYLFTRANQNCFQQLTDSTIQDSFLNSKWPTRIIIHGWLADATSDINQLVKDAYLSKGDFNVIIVEWGNLANDVNYNRVSKLVDDVGLLVAEFLEMLHRENVSYDDIYIIGHSLGAHIAGVAGYLSEGKINTVFALDPAEPNFPLDESRISSSSAKYVESIHTNTGLLGVDYPVGHASFFPNYGVKQRGCKILSCSHSRAYRYFAESINSREGFWGIQCGSMENISKKHCHDDGMKTVMAGEPSIAKEGYFFVPVNWREPFAKGKDIHFGHSKKH